MEEDENNIAQFGHKKHVDYPEQSEMFDRILKIVHEYEMSLAEALGVLELVKDDIKESSLD